MQRELHIRILAAGSCRNLLALHEITTHDQLSVSLFKSYLNRWFLLNGRMPFRTVNRRALPASGCVNQTSYFVNTWVLSLRQHEKPVLSKNS